MTYRDLWSSILATSLFLVCESSSATQPPDVVSSDENGNTAMGSDVLVFLATGGTSNTAAGSYALYDNATGSFNSAFGTNALYANTTGIENTAVGALALEYNTIGSGNTAYGLETLFGNDSGNYNTASGSLSLRNNRSGSYNTAVGYIALTANLTGSYTTAVGSYALSLNTAGGYDTAFGAYSLPENTTGTGNTAFGYAALRSNTTGNSNIGFGYQSLYLDTIGSNNIAMGYEAAYNVRTGSNIIEIGNTGTSGDENVIRIGTQGTQTATYVAGISGATVTGAAVYVTSSGQLGVLASSERYKTAITPIGTNTKKLQRLRPVSFHLKTDPAGAVQYGLIAEEVDKVYPELVIRDDTGKIQGVRYDELAPMLLNEVQQQQATIRLQAAEIRDLKLQQKDRLAAQDQQLQNLQRQMEALLAKLQSKHELVAQR
jgi:hypothetical protein